MFLVSSLNSAATSAKCFSSQTEIIQEKSHRPPPISACLGVKFFAETMACHVRRMFSTDGCFFPFNQPCTSTAFALIESKSTSFPVMSILAHFRGQDLPDFLVAPDICIACSSQVLRNVSGDGALIIAVM